MARVGYLLTPVFLIWLVFALVSPSLVGQVLTALPYLLILTIVAAGILVYGLYRVSGKRWTPVYRRTVILGVVVGIVIGGGIAGTYYLLGCPNLTPTTSNLGLASPNNLWEKADNPAWTVGGVPVFMFYGSAACPYCSATSWAVLAAMESMGTVNLAALQFGYSSPTDVYPNTPEVIVSSIQLQSSYVSMNVNENLNNQTINVPAVDCVVQAYVTTYNSGGSIPFLVINGQYINVGSLVDPGALAGYTHQAIYAQVQAKSGTQWSQDIEPAVWGIQAILVKVNNGNPTSVASDPNVARIVSQIS